MKIKHRIIIILSSLVILYFIMALLAFAIHSWRAIENGLKLTGLVSMLKANEMNINSVMKQEGESIKIVKPDSSDSKLPEIIYDGFAYIDNFSNANLNFDFKNSDIIFLYSKAEFKCYSSSFSRFVIRTYPKTSIFELK